MKRNSLGRSCALAALSLCPGFLAMPALAQEGASPLTDVIAVTGQRPAVTTTTNRIDPDSLPPATGPDASRLVARLPGAAAIGNGALSGQVQYRGLFGPRINIRIDDQAFASGGPNLMDPPLHYVPAPLVDRLEVDRGIGPVSDGPGLAGGVNAVLKAMPFHDESWIETGYDLSISGLTADNSYAVGGMAGIASDTVRLHILASREQGEDIETPYGTIAGSEHDRSVWGVGAGWRSGPHALALDIRRNETGATGNPPFAMDIRYFDTDTARLRYTGDFEPVRVALEAGWSDVAHAMNNYDLRPAPATPMRWRETYADAQTRTVSVSLAVDAMGGELRAGLDRAQSDHDVTITNPNNAAFFLTSFAGIDMRRTGAFVEWTGALPAGWQGEIGLRADHHEAEAGRAATGPAVPAMPGMLAMAFNATQRDRNDTALDAVARLWRPVNDTTTLRLTLARKTRAPGYVERFAWLPTPASGGLADGNTYVGDIGLQPETAWIAEAGLDWQSARAYARPTVFYRRIENYIQGVPFDATPGVIDTPVEMVSAMNGDPTPLRFANVEAELYGVDADFGYRIDAHWRLDGTVSWVRGERRDVDDDLYRIAPPRLRLGASYDAADWSLTLEGLATAEQDRVSLSNGEQVTPGHVVLNLYGRWAVREGIDISAGIENLLDQPWRDHLAGYNRNAGGDIGLGERLPGNGISAGIRISLRG
ncbi:MAG: TonB-dependent receptor [Pseudomonadota bacterium]|nr:TonB-dependent receptor [Pseudomonadota bacterium]